jgi:predicted membrane-bound spermidine synthase
LPRISSAAVSDRGWPQIYIGVGLTTLATLILELSLTRVFSVVFYYHFAFLAISIALFGLGAGGVFSYVVAGWRGGFYHKLGTLAALNSVAVLLSLVYIITRPGAPGGITLALVYFASAAPFFLAGTIVSLAVAETIARVDRVYFFDLLGAAVGCLLLVPFLNFWGGPNTVLASAIVFAASAAIWFNLAGTIRGRVAAVALALGFVLLVVYNGKHNLIDIRYAKGGRLPEEEFVRWNSFSRIGVHKDQYGTHDIVIDADASTTIADFNIDQLTRVQKFNLLHQGPGYAYLIRPGAKALIIGPGGGWDVTRALGSGSKDITAVEINPIIANTIMRDRFAALSKRLYFRPEVHVVVEDGRSFVRRSQDKYQVLQATLVDTWASTAAGAFALSESNLYTSDAFRDYLNHLTDDGLMVFTRWGFDPPRESLRLLSLAMDALGELGETQPWKHVLVLREDAEKIGAWGAQDTVMIFRKPISPDDLTHARMGVAGTTLQLVYVPGDAPANEFGKLLKSPDPEEFWADYPFDVSPVDDDRPFFFYTVQPQDIRKFLGGPAVAADYKINRAVPLLFGSVAVSLLATAVILALPPLLLGTRLPVEKGVRRLLIYFLCIGAGYILIQVALIQKFVLFLGHPTYALTVIIFSMLISSGLGSFFSRRLVPPGGDGRLLAVLLGVTAAVSILSFVAAPVSEYGVGLPLPLKMLIAACLIMPAGFLMGMPFPSGLSRLEVRYPQAVRWAWSLNAAASVLGSAGAIFLAIYLGLRVTLLIGGAMYLGALAVVWLERQPASEKARVSVGVPT